MGDSQKRMKSLQRVEPKVLCCESVDEASFIEELEIVELDSEDDRW